jgi:hypothetical protein
MRWTACFLAAWFAIGCVDTQAVPWTYRLSLAENASGHDAAEECLQDCGKRFGGDGDLFYLCLNGCPGISVEKGAECTNSNADQPPVAACYTRLVEEPVHDDGNDAENAAGVVLGILDIFGHIAAAAAGSSSHDHHASRSASADHHSRHGVH